MIQDYKIKREEANIKLQEELSPVWEATSRIRLRIAVPQGTAGRSRIREAAFWGVPGEGQEPSPRSVRPLPREPISIGAYISETVF